MRTFAHYDAKGGVRALITVDAPEGINIMLAPKPGHFVAEADGLKLKAGIPDTKALRELARSLHISGPLPRAQKR